MKWKIIISILIAVGMIEASAPTSNRVFSTDAVVIRKEKQTVINASRQAASSDQIQLLAQSGLFSEATSVLKTFPGVVGGSDFDARLYVRGGRVSETVFVVDRHLYQFPYFWGGMVSIVNPNLVEKMAFYSGGFPARYGNVMSGVIDATLKEGSRYLNHKALDVTMTEFNMNAGGPIVPYKSAWLVSARRTYYDLLYRDTGNTLLPFYSAYTGKLRFDLTPAHTLRLQLNYFHDRGKINEDAENGFTKSHFEFDTEILVTQLDLESMWLDSLKSETSLHYETMKTSYYDHDVTPVSYRNRQHPISVMQDWTMFLDAHTIRTGGFLMKKPIDVDLNLTLEPDLTVDQSVTLNQQETFSGTGYYGGLYFEDEWQLVPRWVTMIGGVRYERLLNSVLTNMRSLQPRVSLYLGDRRHQSVFMSWGKYTQFDLLLFDDALVNLKPSQAIHYNMGYERQWSAGVFRMGGFYKDYSQLPYTQKDSLTSEVTGYTNEGSGESVGGELFLKSRFGKWGSGWMSYTVSRVRYQDPKEQYYGRQDQRHTLNIVGTVHLSKQWDISTKVQWDSGKPYTPLDRVETHPTLSRNRPVWGAKHSQRLPGIRKVDIWFQYHRLPWPLSQWFPTVLGETYFGVSNLFNTNNIVGYEYNNDYTKRRSIDYLPRMPIFGMKVYLK